MIENLVDAWLTDATERSYEVSFAQLLLIEGHHVIQGPMHHAHEHGKDIIAFNPSGDLCIYQLKSGTGKLNTTQVENVQDQLHAAVTGIVEHPSLPHARTADRVILVTNQIPTPPAQDRIRAISDGYVARRFPSLHLTQKDDLCSRFVAAEGKFFPTKPESVDTFLSLFLADGVGPLPLLRFFRLLEDILPLSGGKPSAAQAQRSISAAALTVAFALRQWTRVENHAEIAVGWFAYCSQVLRLAQRCGLGQSRYTNAYRLGFEEGRRRLELVLDEAVEARDLVIAHPAEPLVYNSRAVKVVGLSASLFLSLRIQRQDSHHVAEKLRSLYDREVEFLKLTGEVEATFFLMLILALSQLGRIRESTRMLLTFIAALSTVNRPDSDAPLPDPYHEVTEILLDKLDQNPTDLEEEDFAGASYTLHVFVACAVRRLWRQHLAGMWSSISKIEIKSFIPRYPIEYLYYRDASGELESWYWDTPTSWSDLLEESQIADPSPLPDCLREHLEFLPFYCVLFPHRLTRAVGDLLDDATS